MNIAGLLKTATIDFPHRLAAVVFTAGCNYNCGFCHNRTLLTETTYMDMDEVMHFLKKRANVLDGIVISGGEPTLQEDLSDFARQLKELGYDVKLDTNGSNPELVEKLLQEALVDYVAMDYKAPFDRYTEICRMDATGVRETLALLRQSNIEWELRTTVIPQLSEIELQEMAKEVGILPAYALQLYRPMGIERMRIYTPQDITKLAESLHDLQPNIMTRC